MNVSSDFYNPANPTNTPEPNNTNISQFLPPVDPQLLEDIEEQVVTDVETSSEAIIASSTPRHQIPDSFLNVVVDTALKTSTQVGNDELDPVEQLAQ